MLLGATSAYAGEAAARWHARNASLPLRLQIIPGAGGGGGAGGASLAGNNIFTSAGSNEFDGPVYYGGNTAAFQNCRWSTVETPDTYVCAMGTTSRNTLFIEAGDEGFDHAHALATNPILFIHSANQSTTQWLGLSHDGSNGIIQAGTGGVLALTTFAEGASGSTRDVVMNSNGILLKSGVGYSWGSNGGDASGGADTQLGRFSAGVIRSGLSTAITGLYGGGAIVASATALPLPTGSVFHVSGVTTITSITSTNFASGACINIIFDGILTLTDGGNLRLAGNFVTSADDTINLCYDGAAWFEIARAVN